MSRELKAFGLAFAFLCCFAGWRINNPVGDIQPMGAASAGGNAVSYPLNGNFLTLTGNVDNANSLNANNLAIGGGSAIHGNANNVVVLPPGAVLATNGLPLAASAGDTGNANQNVYLGIPDPNALLAGPYSVIIGVGSGYYGPMSNLDGQVSIGEYPNVNARRGIGIGAYSVVNAIGGVGIGALTVAGQESFAGGYQANANNIASVAIGLNPNASGVQSVAISTTAQATGTYNICIGRQASSTGSSNSTVIGSGASDGGFLSSVALGQSSTNTAAHQVMLGTASESVVMPGTTNSVGTVTSGTWNGTAIAATSGGTAQTAYALGDTLYSSATNAVSRLAGNTTSAKQFLTQTGNGTVSAAPAWGALAAGDIPATLNATTISTSTTSPAFIVSPNTGSISAASSTELLFPANGTMQLASSTGTFGTLLFGGSTSTTGMELMSANGALTLLNGAGANTGTFTANQLSAINATLSGGGGASSLNGGTHGLVINGNGSATQGEIVFPTSTSGVVAFTQPTGVGASPGFSLNGNISLANGTVIGDTANGTLQVATSTGTFGTIQLGATGATTGSQIVSTGSGNMSLLRGDGSNNSAVTASQFNANNFKTSNMSLSGSVIYGNASFTAANGEITWPSSNTGTVAFTSATGTLAGPAFSFNGTIAGIQIVETSSSGATAVAATNSGGTYHCTSNTAWVLPVPAAGLWYTFVNNGASTVTVATNNTGAQSIFATGLTGGTRTAPTSITSSIRVECYDGTNWVITAMTGTWT